MQELVALHKHKSTTAPAPAIGNSAVITALDGGSAAGQGTAEPTLPAAADEAISLGIRDMLSANQRRLQTLDVPPGARSFLFASDVETSAAAAAATAAAATVDDVAAGVQAAEAAASLGSDADILKLSSSVAHLNAMHSADGSTNGIAAALAGASAATVADPPSSAQDSADGASNCSNCLPSLVCSQSKWLLAWQLQGLLMRR